MKVLPEARLGRTDLRVRRIALGGGYGMSSTDLVYAFERGVNYCFWSSDVHHYLYHRQVSAIHQLFGARARGRHRRVLATVTYVDHPDKTIAALADQMLELKVDYIDILYLGWMTSRPTPDHRKVLANFRNPPLLERFRRRTMSGADQSADGEMRQRAQQVRELSDEMQRRGYVRFVGGSFHDRVLARKWMASDLLDVYMLRYNPLHVGMEREIGPHLPRMKGRPGIIGFNAAMGLAGRMTSLGMDPTDLYRFALRLPWVDAVLCGFTNRAQIDAALAASRKPLMGDEEAARLVAALARAVAGERGGRPSAGASPHRRR